VEEVSVFAMPQRTFVIAWGPVRWFLLLSGTVGITMPWGRVYVLEPWFEDRLLRLHEVVHLRQIRRDGRVRFTLSYLWWLGRHGYWRNPYEIEAYRIEDEARRRLGRNGLPRRSKRPV
jgi:hypothetical protein